MIILLHGKISFRDEITKEEKSMPITEEWECSPENFEAKSEEIKKIMEYYHNFFGGKPNYSSEWEIIVVKSILKQKLVAGSKLFDIASATPGK